MRDSPLFFVFFEWHLTQWTLWGHVVAIYPLSRSSSISFVAFIINFLPHFHHQFPLSLSSSISSLAFTINFLRRFHHQFPESLSLSISTLAFIISSLGQIRRGWDLPSAPFVVFTLFRSVGYIMNTIVRYFRSYVLGCVRDPFRVLVLQRINLSRRRNFWMCTRLKRWYFYSLFTPDLQEIPLSIFMIIFILYPVTLTFCLWFNRAVPLLLFNEKQGAYCLVYTRMRGVSGETTI